MRADYFPFEGGYCKIRTARRRKRAVKKDFEKQLINLHRERRRLERLRDLQPMVQLPEPRQHGWKRTFVLCSSIARSEHAPFWEALLAKINTVQYCENRDFAVHNVKQMAQYASQRLRTFTHPRNEDAACLTTAERRHFAYANWGFGMRYALKKTWRYELRIMPNIVTHVRRRDEALERQYEQLEHFIDHHALRHLVLKLQDGYANAQLPERRERYPFKQKQLHKIVAESRR
ncbi:hypothetical protein MKQ70_06350 [Chitinophaga sedimenti]|uniref:hypothetical protein n=1 Tax=Chitinophaga sedimenti TaxID=2033606 RepID=UPI002004F217|nr:hypothetical protein [Chitinophaga sedimenti]MCK7554644.1 hypothetical protein [Chitinophaga sedimenti]